MLYTDETLQKLNAKKTQFEKNLLDIKSQIETLETDFSNGKYTIEDIIEAKNIEIGISNKAIEKAAKKEIFKQAGKMLALQSLASVVSDLVTSFTISFDENNKLYKEGLITKDEFEKRVAEQVAIQTSIGGAITIGTTALNIGSNYVAQTFSGGLATAGSVVSKALGPAVLIGSLGYQVLIL